MKLMVNKKSGGFTVIELLVALAVFAAVVPAIASGVSSLIVLNNRARDLSIANLMAESKAEELRSLGFNGLTVGTTDISSDLPSLLASPKSANYTVTNPSAGSKVILISITYKDYNKTRVLNYQTIVSELGVGQ